MLNSDVAFVHTDQRPSPSLECTHHRPSNRVHSRSGCGRAARLMQIWKDRAITDLACMFDGIIFQEQCDLAARTDDQLGVLQLMRNDVSTRWAIEIRQRSLACSTQL